MMNMALDYKIIGERLQKVRNEKGLTQEKLAEKLDVSIAFLSRVERGTINVSLKRLSQICSILGMDEGSILNGTSADSENYLNEEFNTLLKDCSSEKLKLLYDIAQVVIKE